MTIKQNGKNLKKMFQDRLAKQTTRQKVGLRVRPAVKIVFVWLFLKEFPQIVFIRDRTFVRNLLARSFFDSLN